MGSGRRANALVNTPKFDPARKLWYCDIELAAGSSYQPFVRLGLCRYQPHSIDGHHLSRVVIGEFSQLLPDRSAQFSRLRIHSGRPAGMSAAGISTSSPDWNAVP